MINYDGLGSNVKNMNYMYKDIYRNGQNYLSANYSGNYKKTNNLTNKNYRPYRPGSQYYRQGS